MRCTLKSEFPHPSPGRLKLKRLLLKQRVIRTNQNNDTKRLNVAHDQIATLKEAKPKRQEGAKSESIKI